jgi:acyl-coenzyme A synthetase/AMP-(fatty) acid ligase
VGGAARRCAAPDAEEFGRRFGCTVWDGFGSTEIAIIITRPDDTPPGSIGQGFPGVAIYNPDTPSTNAERGRYVRKCA